VSVSLMEVFGTKNVFFRTYAGNRMLRTSTAFERHATASSKTRPLKSGFPGIPGTLVMSFVAVDLLTPTDRRA
jgi:hypothetical protein